jgi:CHASE2 domain-containing sensor protein
MILGAAAGRGPSPLRLLGACLGLAALLVGLHLWPPALLSRADLAVYDRLLVAAPLRAPSGRVALVEVDGRSLAEVGRWPWPRDRVAALLDRIRALGAAAIGLDVLFAEPDAGGDGGASGGTALSARDATLEAAFGRGAVVLGYAFTFDRPVDRPCRLRPIALARAATGGALTQVPRRRGSSAASGPSRRRQSRRAS